MASTSTSSSSNVENLPPQVIKRISKEVIELTESPPEGIKLVINEEDITDVQATIEGPGGTPYEGGFFKMKLVLGKEFPSIPPQGFFLTKIFHPNVAKNGAICVNTLKKDWKPDHGIKHILLTIKCLLIYPNPESALNEEAGKLLLEHYDDFSRHAKMMTEIHAKPLRASSSRTDTLSQENGEGETNHTKKPALDKKGTSASVMAKGTSVGGASTCTIDKKKKDKKKALKRL